MSTSLAAAKATVSVEYAKSGRSACKGCSGSIASGALRIGASVRDPRGFDNTKWYHVACFPASSHPLDPMEKVKGFDSIKEHDREQLREVGKNHKTDVSLGGLLVEPSPKKAKVHPSSLAMGLVDKANVSVEYAKSGRSTCKSCGENIALDALRLGVSIHDPRGFGSTKWYHVACFPASSYPLSPVERVKGFDSIKNHDREELRKLEENNKRDGNTVCQLSEPELKEEMGHSMVVTRNKEGMDNNLEEVKGHDMAKSGNKEDTRKNLEKVESSMGNKSLGLVTPLAVSDIRGKYKDATLPTNWKAFKTVIFREQEDGLHDSAKIAAFDFDGCLAKTSVKSIGADKWSLQYNSIPKKLQRLYNNGYKLVIFTNESNIERWKNKRQQAVDSKIGRLDNFINCVKVPIQVFIACGLGKGKGTPDDPFRKPNPGMWSLMTEHFNSGITIDMDQSFYVGDAAGRPNDHSDADVEFAKAIGLKFLVPEEYFAS